MLTAQEMAQALGVATTTIKIWRVHGLLSGHAYNDKGDYLYDPPGEHAPKKAQGLKLSRRSLNDQIPQIVPRRCSIKRNPCRLANRHPNQRRASASLIRSPKQTHGRAILRLGHDTHFGSIPGLKDRIL